MGSIAAELPVLAVVTGDKSDTLHKQEKPGKRRRLNGKTPPSACLNLTSFAAPATVKSFRTLVLNLDRRSDRWKGIQDRLASLERAGVLAMERFPATDGQVEGAIDEGAVLQEWTTDRNSKYDGRPGYRAGVKLKMTPGERGCAMSHVRAWRTVASVGGSDAKDDGCRGVEEPVLIFEDDAVLKKAFTKRLRSAVDASSEAGADVLYLGYINGAPWRRRIAPGLQEAEYLWTTVAYALWPRGARKLLQTPVDCPVDNFMAWQSATKRILAFAVVPELVEQEGEWDFGSDVPHSDDTVLNI